MKGRKISDKSKTFNAKQRSYLINLFTIGGGAALYTEWQILFPLNNDVPYYSFTQQALILTISATMFTTGFFAQKKEKNHEADSD